MNMPKPDRPRRVTLPAALAALLPLPAVLVAGACQPVDDASEYRNAIPTRETVTMKVPGAQGSGAALMATGDTSVTALALLGQTAEFYQMTRNVSRVVNGGAVLVLGLVREVVRHPPTSVGENQAVWGPWTDALSPNTYRVTVTRTGDNEYAYKFEGKARGAADSAYVIVLSGTHRPTRGPNGVPLERFGEGSFVLDWDAAATLPEHGREAGTASYTYSRRGPALPTTVGAQFRSVNDEDRPGQRVDADYAYGEAPDGSGTLDFTFTPSMVATGPARFSVKSRWQADGAGRADVRATGGEVPAGESATASECWDALFRSTYLTASWSPALGWGQASACVFSDATYSTLLP